MQNANLKMQNGSVKLKITAGGDALTLNFDF